MIDYGIRAATESDCDIVAEAIAISSGGYAQLGWQEKQDEYAGLSLPEIGSRRYMLDKAPFTWRNCMVADAKEPLGVLLAYGIDADYESVEPVEAQENALDVYYPVKMEVVDSWYICGMTVFEPWRGKGIGSRFLEVAGRQAIDNGYNQLSLIAFEQNAGSVRLYLRNGFSVVERRTIVPHPMIEYTGDALLMVAQV